jgi:uncharacterized protein YxeA
MYSSFFVLSFLLLLINSVFSATNNASSSNGNSNGNSNGKQCQLNNKHVAVTYQFDICIDHKYYRCYKPTNYQNTSGNNNPMQISFYNQNNVLQKANCYHVNNNCRNSDPFITFDCASNISSTFSGNVTTSSSKDCIVTQSNGNANNNTELQCTVIINAAKKEYLYAFIAVIVLIIIFFCCCPACCIYYYCRYHGGSEMYKNYRQNNKKNKNTKNNNNNNNNMNTTNYDTNNNRDGDASYDQNEEMVSFSNKKINSTELEVERQPIYNANANRGNMNDTNDKDGFSGAGTNVNDEIVV